MKDTSLYFFSALYVLAFSWLIIFYIFLISHSSTPEIRKSNKSHIRHEKKKDKQRHLKEKIIKNKHIYQSDIANKSYFVSATVYNADPRQCNTDYLTTASGFKLNKNNQYKHRIIAVSRDLLKLMPFGTKILINGTAYDGVYTVQDVMNRRYSKKIDILINKNQKIGKWDGVQIKIL